MKYYVTTPLYYVNSTPHIGTAYTTVMADIVARYKRLQGYKVFFLTGTDEHGLKIQRAAEKAGKEPKEFCDSVVEKFKDAWKKLNISYDYFIRTTDPNHEEAVKHLFLELKKKGDIYLGTYKGYYCVSCENYVAASKLKEGKYCPDCGKEVETMEEESYFFRLSKYQDALLEYYEKNPDFILPRFRANEIINFVKSGLQDLSISRTSFKWGIPVPFDEKHVFYVWFDALTNYISAVGYPHCNEFWPADVHFVGKDILKFHAIIWPAMLLALGLELPKTIFAHGWWLIGKEKVSKSKGNIVDPLQLAEKYGVDALRYFYAAEIPFGQDGEFSEENLKKRLNNELADNLGNLALRVFTLINKFCNGIIPLSRPFAEFEDFVIKRIVNAELHFDKFEFHLGVIKLNEIVNEANRLLNDKAPWKKDVAKEERERVLYNLAEALRIISIAYYPIMPESMGKLRKMFGFAEKLDFANAKKFSLIPPMTRLGNKEILFRKVE
ncbi:MAG: methionine--tRNA ligase [Candidatus Iainarchaeum archaeon]|uniref:methionine--tRNA ligase n=1 Tax=Candidatus Iainarchaeum sp. TaxID=3101447 RepID=A0A497JIW0_9ARCH|nr:MAG: methionine--tRNA ligase [Candidatus Diapherotrites archaeon]